MSFDFESVNQHVKMVCPLTHAHLVKDGESLVACEPENRLRYRIEDGIPVMLVDEAEPVPEAEWRELMTQHGRDASGNTPADD